MIRRSTLVFLTCLAALGVPAMRMKSAAFATTSQESTSQLLLAQVSGDGALSTPLSLGAKGDAVSDLQHRLRQSEHYNGSVDGIYGRGTQKAVNAFQADQGLAQTGTLTDETWRRLQRLSPQGISFPGTQVQDVQVQLPPIQDISSVDNPDGDEGDNVSPQPATVPADSELPSLGATGTADAVVIEGSDGGLGKVFGLSLVVVALLSSFGVGFYMANRGKSESESLEGDDWGVADGGVGSLPQGNLGSISKAASASLSKEPFQGVGSGTAGNAVLSYGSGSTSNGSSAIAPTAANSLHTGQMGGTAPLAQVDIIEGLIGDLRNPDPTRRRKAIWELGQRGNSLAMQPLVDSMVSADSKEKSLVLAALSEIGIRSLKPMSRALAIALQDDNPEVRKNAIRDLTRVYDLVVQISQMLGHATEDEDPEVRQTATWALDQLSRIRRSQDLDSTMRTFAGTSTPTMDLLSSEASIRSSQ